MGFLQKLFGVNKEVSPVPSEEELAPEPNTEEVMSVEEEEHDRKYKFETLRDDGLRALQIGQVEYAVKCFTTALQYEEDANTMRHLAESYIMMRNGESALPLLEKLIKEEPDNSDYPIIAAQAAEIAEKYETMEQYARKATAMAPDNETALYMLGRCLYLQQRFDEAEICFTQLLEQAEEYSNVRGYRINCRIEEGKLEEALEDVQYLISTNAATEATFIAKGNIHVKQSETTDAIEAYEKAIEMNPFNIEAPLKLTDIALSQNQLQQAINYLDEAIKMQENFPEAYSKRAEIKELLGDAEGAEEDRKKAQNMVTSEECSEGKLENEMNNRYKSMNPYGF